MNISGIRPNAGFYDYNSIQNIRNAVEDTPVVKTAADAGVHILAYDCAVTEDSMKICDPIPVRL